MLHIIFHESDLQYGVTNQHCLTIVWCLNMSTIFLRVCIIILHISMDTVIALINVPFRATHLQLSGARPHLPKYLLICKENSTDELEGVETLH